jgi:membrane-bound ClpP family serine protease
LLISGFVALVVGRTNLVPSKVETLGVTFNTTQQANFRYLVGAVVVYFVLLFSKEILLELANSKKYYAAVKGVEAYRASYQIGPELPKEWELNNFSITSQFMSFLV